MSYVPLPPQSFSGQQNEHFVIVNGHRVPYTSGMYGQDLISMAGTAAGRRVVRIAGGWLDVISPSRFYGPEDLVDRSGNPIKIKSLPNRSKGGFFDFLLGRNEREPQTVAAPQKPRQAEAQHQPSRPAQHPGQRSAAPAQHPGQRPGQYVQRPAQTSSQRPPLCPSVYEGARSDISRRIIREQVEDLGKNYFKSNVILDEKCDWCIFPSYRLPRGWSQETTSLLITFPVNFPMYGPPVGFYLPASLPLPPGLAYDARHAHTAAPLLEGWRWHCCYVDSWQPAPLNAPWQDGDSMWTFIILIREVLSLK